MIKVKRKDICQIKLKKTERNETLYLCIKEDSEIEQVDGMLIVTELKLDYQHYYFGLEKRRSTLPLWESCAKCKYPHVMWL